MLEPILEINYETATFKLDRALRELSRFASLMSEECEGARREGTDSTVPEHAVGAASRFNVRFRFPYEKELAKGLADAHNIPLSQVPRFFGGETLTFGEAGVYISSAEGETSIRLFPATRVISQLVLRSEVVQTQIAEFCRATGAVEAHWENWDEEVLCVIWPGSAAGNG